MSKVAFCFPGQGALEAGMGRELAEAVPAAMEVYRVGSEASGLDLRKLCFDSPLEEMVETDVQQPALLETVVRHVFMLVRHHRPAGQQRVAVLAMARHRIGAVHRFIAIRREEIGLRLVWPVLERRSVATVQFAHFLQADDVRLGVEVAQHEVHVPIDAEAVADEFDVVNFALLGIKQYFWCDLNAIFVPLLVL